MFLFLGLKIATLIGSLLSTAGFIGFFAFTATLGSYKWPLLIGGLVLVGLAEGLSYLLARQPSEAAVSYEVEENAYDPAAQYKQSDTEIGRFAAKLNGRAYGEELTSEEESYAAQKGWVVVYGEADDHCICSGAFSEVFSAWSGVSLHCANGVITDDAKEGAKGPVIKMYASANGWQIETSIKGAEKFLIVNEGMSYGEGLVFSMENCESAPAL